MATYCSETVYVYSVTDLEARLTRIDTVITALEQAMIDSGASSSGISGYSLDDGQTKINTTYRDVGAIAESISKWELIRERIINKLNGRQFAVRPWRGLL